MDVYLVFNELCLTRSRTGIQHKSLAQGWMEQFGDVLTQARRYGVKVLRVTQGFFELSLVPNYTIREWTFDREIDRELKRRIQSAATSYDEDTPDAVEDNKKRLAFEFKYDGIAADGLGFAFLLESIAVSLDTEDCWKSTEISLAIDEIIETEDDIQIIQTVKPARHISHKDHLELHRKWLQEERFTTSVQDGTYLLSKASDWFPGLIILDNARPQIQELSHGTPQIRQLVSKLFELENYCRGWSSGPFDKDKIASKATPESASVAGNAHYAGMRTFKLPDGREEYFEWHLRLTPGPWRLFFLPNSTDHIIYVGYVGRKLPSKKYPTV